MSNDQYTDFIEIPDTFAPQIEKLMKEMGADYKVAYTSKQAKFTFRTLQDVKSFIDCWHQINKSIRARFGI
jgi:hypothetical protein